VNFCAPRFSVVATAVVSASSSRMSDGGGELESEWSAELYQLNIGEVLVGSLRSRKWQFSVLELSRMMRRVNTVFTAYMQPYKGVSG
jgi:hypothetical protein